MASIEVVTAEELLRLPEVTCRYELVRGTLISLPLSGRIRGRTAARFASSIGMHVDAHQLGAAYVGGTGFILSRGPDTVRAPDIAFVSKDRLPPNDEHEGYLELAPDLAVEVISPSDRMSAVLDKVAEYLDAGTRLVVIVALLRKELMLRGADRSVRVLMMDDTFDGGDVLPGFSLPVAVIFS